MLSFVSDSVRPWLSSRRRYFHNIFWIPGRIPSPSVVFCSWQALHFGCIAGFIKEVQWCKGIGGCVMYLAGWFWSDLSRHSNRKVNTPDWPSANPLSALSARIIEGGGAPHREPIILHSCLQIDWLATRGASAFENFETLPDCFPLSRHSFTLVARSYRLLRGLERANDRT